jgi:hypothetical protein
MILCYQNFTTAIKQNVLFLVELDDCYRFKAVPECLKLPITMKAVGDAYSKQWFTSVYKDLQDYSHFKKAFTELLWSPQIQSQVRAQLYQDRYDKSSGESLSFHFLMYSMTATNLSPTLSELDLIDDIAGHFPTLHTERAFVGQRSDSTGGTDVLKQIGNVGASKFAIK